MKILIYYIRNYGGVGRVMEEIIPLLKDKGFEVECISREDDLKCYSLLQSFFKIRNLIKRKKYDILFTQDWGCALPFIFKKNHCCLYHGMNINKIGRIFQKFVYFMMKRNLLVVSNNLKKKFPNAKVIPNGVNFNKFKDLGLKRDKLGWVYKKEEWNVDTISMEDAFELAKSYGLELSVANNIKPEDMNKWYNELKVFVNLPTWYTGFNLSWLEAKASGVPIIIGNENGIGCSEVLINYKKYTWENTVNKLLDIFYKTYEPVFNEKKFFKVDEEMRRGLIIR